MQLRKLLILTVLIPAIFAGNIGTNSAQAAGLTAKQRQVLATNLKKSDNTIRWFHSKKYNWRLHKRFDTCKDVKARYSSKRAGICYLSRLSYNAHKERREKIRKILFPAPKLPPHYSAWMCIHSHEGAWDNPGVDWLGNYSGYYGGLQMDMQFQRTYGAELLRTKGTANNWTPLEQMWVAEKAYSSGRGFYPWPNTARYCGLI